jgi:SsrA-binding protein
VIIVAEGRRPRRLACYNPAAPPSVSSAGGPAIRRDTPHELAVTQDGIKVVATNRSAGRDYFLGDHVEAGLALQGSEVKSVRAGQVSLKEAYVRIEGGQAWLLDAHIAPYQPASRENHDPRRPRRLLLHKRELLRLEQGTRQKGLTLVPTRMYLKRGRAKLEFALARGKRKYDKRQAWAEREAKRSMERALGRRR